ncbi:putative methyltransferase YdaC [Saccoglossus kowalevskii]|uniref:24-methylenesterol C-methyltransferase 2-like n=1 Tax=Saccoglossus kowalevskii TaxID=10224 RepID=A0ABM0M819_SACKO|nr:PREDICTED: 24-methylenesterol C-methyltransferase 2-like [Saccoglossus kowalevskii]
MATMKKVGLTGWLIANYLPASTLTKHLRKPTGLIGWALSKHVLAKINLALEKKAVEVLDIQPHHNVLEVGFGHGLGMKEAAKYVKTESGGKVRGVDFSPTMVKQATSNLKTEVSKGLVEILEGNVMDLPFGDDSFDAVYHCNCYYFWPSIDTGCREVLRVMKPGAKLVTTVDMKFFPLCSKLGVNTDPIMPNIYAEILKKVGFVDVNMFESDKITVIVARQPSQTVI